MFEKIFLYISIFKSYIVDISSFLNRINFESWGPCGLENWIAISTAGEIIPKTFKTPVFFFSFPILPLQKKLTQMPAVDMQDDPVIQTTPV
ncbi:hypothetical protein VP01_3494g2 [Puccinia sorghi]|uniref:Uncharacterized protein n=1 Tax=Puccinia sorghi TaxID=27349 RepID=A0A0L6UVT7_9BASI|nr:hypothetical protein VP01_3494g2 [Puccinia sorghi]